MPKKKSDNLYSRVPFYKNSDEPAFDFEKVEYYAGYEFREVEPFYDIVEFVPHTALPTVVKEDRSRGYWSQMMVDTEFERKRDKRPRQFYVRSCFQYPGKIFLMSRPNVQAMLETNMFSTNWAGRLEGIWTFDNRYGIVPSYKYVRPV